MSDYFDKVASTWDQDPMKVDRAKATAMECKQLALQARQHLLDFGGGTGLLSVCLADAFEQITIADTSKEMLGMAEQKIKDAQLANIKTQLIDKDITELTTPFSAIVTLMALHHVDDIEAFLRGAWKLLDSGGALMIADLYADNGLFHSHNKEFNGHNGFDTDELSGKLLKAGFKVGSVSSYYRITKAVSTGENKEFPLFFMVAEKL